MWAKIAQMLYLKVFSIFISRVFVDFKKYMDKIAADKKRAEEQSPANTKLEEAMKNDTSLEEEAKAYEDMVNSGRK